MIRRALPSLCLLLMIASSVWAYDDPSADYLATRETLAPAEASSRTSLRQILGTGDFAHVELVGDISGKAFSAPSLRSGSPRTLMMTLDDGSSVALRAGEEIDALAVGTRIAVIASTGGRSSSDDLTLESWVHEWDLPRDAPEAGEDECDEQQPGPIERDEAAAPFEAPDEAPSTPPQLPRPVAQDAVQIDAVESWKTWVLDLNSKLTDQQARDIVRWVMHYAQEYDVNHKLIFALIKWESWFNPGCVSHAGAIGLMQLMPGTARGLGVNPRNVQQNIDGGTRYLAEQLGKYRDRPNYERVILALACYNAGPNAVKRAGHRVPNISETQSYVKKVSKTFYELHQAEMP
ncbi:MAG: lytic transglycosylase domain-containing protein [Armatimonadota bacterium]